MVVDVATADPVATADAVPTVTAVPGTDPPVFTTGPATGIGTAGLSALAPPAIAIVPPAGTSAGGSTEPVSVACPVPVLVPPGVSLGTGLVGGAVGTPVDVFVVGVPSVDPLSPFDAVGLFCPQALAAKATPRSAVVQSCLQLVMAAVSSKNRAANQNLHPWRGNRRRSSKCAGNPGPACRGHVSPGATSRRPALSLVGHSRSARISFLMGLFGFLMRGGGPGSNQKSYFLNSRPINPPRDSPFLPVVPPRVRRISSRRSSRLASRKSLS